MRWQRIQSGYHGYPIQYKLNIKVFYFSTIIIKSGCFDIQYYILFMLRSKIELKDFIFDSLHLLLLLWIVNNLLVYLWYVLISMEYTFNFLSSYSLLQHNCFDPVYYKYVSIFLFIIYNRIVSTFPKSTNKFLTLPCYRSHNFLWFIEFIHLISHKSTWKRSY